MKRFRGELEGLIEALRHDAFGVLHCVALGVRDVGAGDASECVRSVYLAS